MKGLCFAIILLTTFVINGLEIDASKQQVPFTVLESSERVASDIPFITALAAAPPSDGEQLYALRSDTGDAIFYDRKLKLAKTLSSSMQAPEVLAVGNTGQVYLVDSESKLRILKPGGEVLRTFRVPMTSSLAELSDENIVIASAINGKLLHLYSPTGRLLRSFGKMKVLDHGNQAQNHFLNRGKVLAGPSDEIFYVFKYAPVPIAMRFSKEGKFLAEFVIEGTAVDIQSEMARLFLRTKDSNTVGGFNVITSAGVDPVTGRLWISMNGSSESGVIYEYATNGEKLREYALLIKSSSPEIVTGVKDIIVRDRSIHILTWESQVYRFSVDNSSTSKPPRAKQGEQYVKQQFVRFGRWEPPMPAFTLSLARRPAVLQLPCPQEQPLTCTVNCPSNSSPVTQDCAAEIRRRLAVGDRIISGSCTINSSGNGGCSANATSSNPSNGVRVTYSVTLNCNAPSGGGGGGGFDFCAQGQADCESQIGGFWIEGPPCRCYDPSPVLVDTLGNGFDLTNAINGVHFDINGDGDTEGLSWTAAGSDDGFLALDRDGNGMIANGKELFGNFTTQPPSTELNGFLALAEFDKVQHGGNGDGKIDSRDFIYSLLRLWRDSNHNGMSEPGELHTLASLGVRSIDLDYEESKRTDQHGNQFRYRGKVRDEQGAHVGRWAWDVFLITAP